MSPQGVLDEVYERVRAHLSERELSELSYEIMAINAGNRVNVAFRLVPDSYEHAFGLDKADLS